MTYPMIVCQCCEKGGRRAPNGWIFSCYQRWLRAKRPESGPRPPQRPRRGPGRAPRTRSHQYRLDEYTHLRACGVGEEEAAALLGVCRDTIRNYERELNEMEMADV